MWNLQRFIKQVVSGRSFSANSFRNVYNFDISEEVMFALKNKQAIVALESTIITHGMPYPNNLECALEVENIVRKQGAVPATIAIISGKVTIGLNNEQLLKLADVKTTKSIKTSRRDLPFVISQKLNGGTTVSGTIVIAEKVGIPIFVTGGIGGVHRQGEKTLDISADLTELGRSPIAVVSSGIKSILDIPKTLEYLETQGVFVATFGETKDFPAFYSRTSGCQAPYNVTNAYEAAKVIDASLSADMKSGLLFGVPIPEKHALEPEIIEEFIEKALEEAIKKNVIGKLVTPYLLEKVKNLTGGQSLEASILSQKLKKALKEASEKNVIGKIVTPFLLEKVNNLTGGQSLEASILSQKMMKALKEASEKNEIVKIVTPFLLEKVNNLTGGQSLYLPDVALIKNNAKVGAEIAVQLFQIRNGEREEQISQEAASPIVIGGAVVDSCAKLHKQEITTDTTT